MAETRYCWRCDKDVPMLNEQEWQQLLPDLQRGIEEIQRYRTEHGGSLQEAKEHVWGQGALERYYRLTGYREVSLETLWHHRLSNLGPPCRACGKPLRTQAAKLCAACGASVR